MPLRKFHLVTTCKWIWIKNVFFSLRTVWSPRPCVISIKHIKVLEENLRRTHDAAARGPSKGKRSIRTLFSNSRTVLCSRRKKWSMYISLAPYDDRRGTKWLMARCRNRGTIDVTFRYASFHEVFWRNDLLWHFQHFFPPFLRLLTTIPPPKRGLILLSDKFRESDILRLCIYNHQITFSRTVSEASESH